MATEALRRKQSEILDKSIKRIHTLGKTLVGTGMLSVIYSLRGGMFFAIAGLSMLFAGTFLIRFKAAYKSQNVYRATTHFLRFLALSIILTVVFAGGMIWMVLVQLCEIRKFCLIQLS